MRVPVVLLKKLVPVIPLVMTRGPFSATYPNSFSVRVNFERSMMLLIALFGPAFVNIRTDPFVFPNKFTSPPVARGKINGEFSNTNELLFK